jgi:transcriptional regulator with XRE-family HTH domain
MLAVELMTPMELAQLLARRARQRRLAQELTQQGLAQRAGVTLGTLKRFERTGQISLLSLLRIAVALGVTSEFEGLFPDPPLRTLADLEQRKQRQRGRRT